MDAERSRRAETCEKTTRAQKRSDSQNKDSNGKSGNCGNRKSGVPREAEGCQARGRSQNNNQSVA